MSAAWCLASACFTRAYASAALVKRNERGRAVPEVRYGRDPVGRPERTPGWVAVVRKMRKGRHGR